MGNLLQFVLVLSDQYTIVKRLIFRKLRVGMTADNQVEPGVGLCHLDITIIADV